ncbi:MAG TPA: hypothetical protein VF600_17080 [Abditibacteriaceae bacterium]|jgi:hypothetical protein
MVESFRTGAPNEDLLLSICAATSGAQPCRGGSAAGGLDGFFPPLLLGLDKQMTGNFILGFVALSVFALSVFALLCWIVCRTVRAGIVEQPSTA